VFRIWIRIRPDPKLFGLKDPDPDPKLLILDPEKCEKMEDPDPEQDPDPPFFHTKIKNMFLNLLKTEQTHHNFIHNT